MDDLSHFLEAQNQVLEAVLSELFKGRKRSHWMWFVFPQRQGLGHSEMSRRYAIRDLDHARRYLRHPVLGTRLKDHAALVRYALRNADLETILGPVDAAKFRSSMALFQEAAAAEGLSAHAALFQELLEKVGAPERA